MNKLDALRHVLPNQKLRSICRSVERHNDLELLLWIIQREAILELGFDSLSLIVRRDDNADRRFPVLLLHRPCGHAPPKHKKSGISEVDIEDDGEAEPEE